VIDADRLIACAVGGDDDEVEQHVLACAPCAVRFAAFVRLGPAIGALLRAGGAGFVATRSLVARLDSEHLISRRYALAPGTVVPCAVGADDVYSLTVLELPAGPPPRVDLVRRADRLVDVPVDDGHVYLVTPSALIRTLPSMKIPFRAVDPSGDRTLAEYTLDHTALHSPP
jgi:hypothetical protein